MLFDCGKVELAKKALEIKWGEHFDGPMPEGISSADAPARGGTMATCQIGSEGPDVTRVQLRLHAVLRQKSMRGEIAVFVASSFASETMPMKIYAAKLGTDAETQTCVRGISQEKTHV